jgi:TolB protein
LLVHADGTPLRRLTRNFGFGPSWAPDGLQLAFSTNLGVFVIDRDGTGLHRLAKSAGSPAWSPDGRTIAFIRGGRRASLWLIDANGHHARPLHVAVISDYNVAWSPDGRRIVFTPRSGRGLYTVSAEGGGIRRLTNGQDGTPAWLR